MTATKIERIELAGVTFEFTIDVVADVATLVRVIMSEPTFYEQTFHLPPDVDVRSYALGWWQCRVRDVIHLL